MQNRYLLSCGYLAFSDGKTRGKIQYYLVDFACDIKVEYSQVGYPEYLKLSS